MLITTIDVGLLHLAYILIQLDQRQLIWHITSILEFRMLDITKFDCDRATCTLHHDKCVTDYLRHLFLSCQVFKQADVILVEQQPIPFGLIAVQELIRNEFRHKVHMVSPRSVHAFFGIGKLYRGPNAYLQRKAWVTTFAQRTLHQWNVSFEAYERQHDLADAWCQFLFYIYQLNRSSVKGHSHYFVGKCPISALLTADTT